LSNGEGRPPAPDIQRQPRAVCRAVRWRRRPGRRIKAIQARSPAVIGCVSKRTRRAFRARLTAPYWLFIPDRHPGPHLPSGAFGRAATRQAARHRASHRRRALIQRGSRSTPRPPTACSAAAGAWRSAGRQTSSTPRSSHGQRHGVDSYGSGIEASPFDGRSAWRALRPCRTFDLQPPRIQRAIDRQVSSWPSAKAYSTSSSECSSETNASTPSTVEIESTAATGRASCTLFSAR